ncbi:MAG: metallophosphoesterase, partial [Methanoregula sp.]
QIPSGSRSLMSLRLPEIKSIRYLSLILLVGFVPASLGYLYTEGKSPAEITTLEVKGAPAGIVFIADPHLRESNIDQTREIIRQINELHPSLVLIGGDFVYDRQENLSLQTVWSEVDAPVYAVLGNHDYQSGIVSSSCWEKTLTDPKPPLQIGDYDALRVHDDSADYAYADKVAGVLAKNGVKVLRNEYDVITIDGRSVTIVGVDDGWAGMAHPPDVPELLKNDSFVIYMIHEPAYRGNGDADLTLAGHTHGGQIYPAGFERVISGGMVTLSGKIDEGGKITYISRGIGTSNLDITLRASPPEIVVINPPLQGQADNGTSGIQLKE